MATDDDRDISIRDFVPAPGLSLRDRLQRIAAEEDQLAERLLVLPVSDDLLRASADHCVADMLLYGESLREYADSFPETADAPGSPTRRSARPSPGDAHEGQASFA